MAERARRKDGAHHGARAAVAQPVVGEIERAQSHVLSQRLAERLDRKRESGRHAVDACARLRRRAEAVVREVELRQRCVESKPTRDGARAPPPADAAPTQREAAKLRAARERLTECVHLRATHAHENTHGLT
eukprot:4937200-Pleurochrysis_carterae.AAC.1